MAYTLNRVRRRPEQVAAQITAAQFGVRLGVESHDAERTVFVGLLQPPEPFCTDGYPVERVRVVVGRHGEVSASPFGHPKRRWKHREMSGELCMWYVEDPRELRWEWDEGFDVLVQIIHRHLVYEEFWRREGKWPVEDARHGRGGHPVETVEMKWAQQRGTR